jgi:tetratricopeptide (TPR) repeat protein
LNPDYGKAYFYRAEAKRALNNNNGACEDYHQAKALGQDDAEESIGIFCIEQNNTEGLANR